MSSPSQVYSPNSLVKQPQIDHQLCGHSWGLPALSFANPVPCSAEVRIPSHRQVAWPDTTHRSVRGSQSVDSPGAASRRHSSSFAGPTVMGRSLELARRTRRRRCRIWDAVSFPQLRRLFSQRHVVVLLTFRRAAARRIASRKPASAIRRIICRPRQSAGTLPVSRARMPIRCSDRVGNWSRLPGIAPWRQDTGTTTTTTARPDDCQRRVHPVRGKLIRSCWPISWCCKSIGRVF